ncbi:cold-shock protein [Aeromicrobium sp. Leaf350]|uniref:cold-shock protein n=1 Tax=Aeromicrobium sp. Leaf350 TaxID=2876565 RepID=UPI001E59FE9C|nr:cold shock domain-containing protein [Aeromicrobium sp. Leaf350]
MAVGTVDWYDWQAGEGRIVPDDGGPDVPVDHHGITATEPVPLHSGQRVRFDVLPGPTGLAADNVRGVCAA